MSKMLPIFRIIKPGIYTSFQDLGRFGYRHLGVPWSGAMDRLSYLYVNQKLGNDISEPVLEIMGAGLVLEALSDTTLFWSGANAEFVIDDKVVQNQSEPLEIKEGQTISLKSTNFGVWTYLTIKHGFDVQKIMGSASSMNGTPLNRINKNDILYQNTESTSKVIYSKLKAHDLNSNLKIKVSKGPEFNWLKPDQLDRFIRSDFQITKDYSRMGYRLSGPTLLLNHSRECITSAVIPGTVQLLPNGQLIVLMKACQTTGGYPRVFQLQESDISYFAQKRAGDTVMFECLD